MRAFGRNDQLLGELNCPDSAGPAKPDPFARLEAHNQWFVAQDVRLDVNAVRKGPGKVFLLDDLVACHVTKLLCRLIEGDIEFSAFLSTSLHLQSVPRWPRQKSDVRQARPHNCVSSPMRKVSTASPVRIQPDLPATSQA